MPTFYPGQSDFIEKLNELDSTATSAVLYTAQSLSSDQAAQARANIGFDAAVRAVALAGLSLATSTAIEATDSHLVAFGKAQAQITLRAPLASPAFTGTPTAPTATLGTNTTQIATTAFVQAAVQALVDSAPGALDTLNELAAALGDDANFASTVTTALAGKAALAGATFTGPVEATSFTGPLTGNASTATALATARAINGVNFDGTAAITITAAAGTLTGTALASTVVSASINAITPTGGALGVTGRVEQTVADAAVAGRFIGDTGRLRVRPYVDGTLGALLDSTNTAEDTFLPMTFGGSAFKFLTGAATFEGAVSAGGIITAGGAASIDGNWKVQANVGGTAVSGIGVNDDGGYGVYLTYDRTARYGGNAAAVRNIANSPLYFETNNVGRGYFSETGIFNALYGAAVTGLTTLQGVAQGGSSLNIVTGNFTDTGIQFASTAADAGNRNFALIHNRNVFGDLVLRVSNAAGGNPWTAGVDLVSYTTGLVAVTGAVSASTRFNLPSYTVATLPAAGAASGLIFVADETGGAVPAFSDGTDWRRVTDRAVVS